MPKNIAALFDGTAPARHAKARLEHAGFEPNSITLLSAETAAEYARRSANETAGVLAGTAGGAGIAGVAGLLLGLVASADSNDDARRVLASLGIPAHDAEAYAQEIANGNALVLVQTSDDKAGIAQSILDSSGTVDLESSRARRALESEFRRDFSSRFETSGYNYRQIAPAYRYGHQLAEDDLFQGKDWNLVESSAYREWEHDNPNTWEQVKDAVKQGFLQNKKTSSGGYAL